MQKAVKYVLGVGAIVLTSASSVFAGGAPVPEIDANLVSVGLGVLAAGVLIVRSRRK